jgi:hypothetical protein
VLIARHNALVISGPIAYRFAVYGAAIEAGAVVSTELAQEPAEALRLPLTRDVAQGWLLLHFEDLSPERMRAVLDELTRPTGPRADLA